MRHFPRNSTGNRRLVPGKGHEASLSGFARRPPEAQTVSCCSLAFFRRPIVKSRHGAPLLTPVAIVLAAACDGTPAAAPPADG